MIDLVNAPSYDPAAPNNLLTEDAAPALTECMLSIMERGAGQIGIRQDQKYYINSPLYVMRGISLKGWMPSPDFMRWSNDPIPNEMDFLRWGSQFVIGPNGYIVLHSSASLDGVVITNSDILKSSCRRIPSTNLIEGFSTTKTAVTIEGEGCAVQNALILGFNLAIESKQSRPTIRNIRGDNYNGIRLQNSWDVARVSDVHWWPYLTVNNGDKVASLRTGNNNFAFKILSGCDWPRLTNNFSFGYQYSYWLSGGNSIILDKCGADGFADIHPGSIACVIDGEQDDIDLHMFQAAGHHIGIYGQLGYPNGSENKTLSINHARLWGNRVGLQTGIGNNTTKLIDSVIRNNSKYGIFATGETSRLRYRDTSIFNNGVAILNYGAPLVDLGGNIIK